jgi:CheY-like chemotaxis protein
VSEDKKKIAQRTRRDAYRPLMFSMTDEPLKILLAEDDPRVRRLIHRVLATAFQAEVCEVADGLDALEQLPHKRFELVILDIGMKVIDGTETLQAIRRTAALRSLPVVMISGVLDNARVKQLVGLNASEIIAKPFTPRELEQRLAPVVARLHRRGAPALVPRSARLNLRPSSRVFLVGPPDPFRELLSAQLGPACAVACYDAAATALRDVLADAPDAIFITGDDLLLPAALLARKIRVRFKAMPRVFLCEPSAAPFSDDDRWFDGRLQKATTPHGVWTALRPLLTDSGMAYAVLHERSPLVEALVASAAAAVEATMQTPVRSQPETPAWRGADQRTIEASIPLDMDEMTGMLTVLVTYEYGLCLASAEAGGASLDVIGEQDLLDSTAAFAKRLAIALAEALTTYAVRTRLGRASARVAEGHSHLTHPSVGRTLLRWLTTSERQVFTAALRIETAALTTASV